MGSEVLSLRIEFSGGLELLFSNVRSHRITIPAVIDDGKPVDINYLIFWLRDNLLKEREELFLENGTVCVRSIFARTAYFHSPNMIVGGG